MRCEADPPPVNDLRLVDEVMGCYQPGVVEGSWDLDFEEKIFHTGRTLEPRLEPKGPNEPRGVEPEHIGRFSSRLPGSDVALEKGVR